MFSVVNEGREYYLSDRLGEARTQDCLWSCLTDASPSAPSLCNGEGWGKNAPGEHYKGRSVVKNGSGNRYKQDPFQGTLPVGIR